MSSSTSARRQRPPRVLREAQDAPARPGLLQLDLAPGGLARLDPDRIDAAVQQGHEAGFDAGYADGAAAGRAEALAAATAEQAAITQAHARRLAAVLEAAEAQIDEALSGVTAIAEATARVTTSAVLTLAEAVVGRELALATNPGRDAIARALAITPEGVDLTLRLHPDDAALLEPEDLPGGTSVRVVPDPTVARGDCLADTGWSHIDARISTALDRVRAVLEAAG